MADQNPNGGLCPVCPTWTGTVDEEWRAHLVEEHPAAWERIRAAVRSSIGGARMAARAGVSHDLTAAAHRSKDRARPAA